MDIRTQAVEETNVLHLRGADDELLYDGSDKSKPVTVTLYGPGSKPFAKAQAARSNRQIDRIKKKGKSDQSADETREENAIFFAACTQSMSHVEIDDLEGAALHKAVYLDAGIGFITEQVNKHLGEWGNFTKGSTKA